MGQMVVGKVNGNMPCPALWVAVPPETHLFVPPIEVSTFSMHLSQKNVWVCLVQEG